MVYNFKIHKITIFILVIAMVISVPYLAGMETYAEKTETPANADTQAEEVIIDMTSVDKNIVITKKGKTFIVKKAGENKKKQRIASIKNKKTTFVITGNTSSHSINISGKGEYNVVLSDTAITNTNPLLIKKDAKVKMTLQGKNILSCNEGETGTRAALELQGEKTALDINGEGSLKAVGSEQGAAIGGAYLESAGNITISGGTIKAYSNLGAAIGSGNVGWTGDITINGGNIYTTAKGKGAGIGSGSFGFAENITINDGNILSSSKHGAAVGTGNIGTAKNIIINDGKINASSDNSTAIGSGQKNGSVKNIIINNGIVLANGGENSAGIGSSLESDVKSIIINDGFITASGAEEVADIGEGSDGKVKSVEINGGSVYSKNNSIIPEPLNSKDKERLYRVTVPVTSAGFKTVGNLDIVVPSKDNDKDDSYKATTVSSGAMNEHWGLAEDSAYIYLTKGSQYGITIGKHKNVHASVEKSNIKNQIFLKYDYKAKFDGNGGTVNAKSKDVIYGKTFGKLPTAERKGYVFKGWFTKKKGGKKITSLTKVTITKPTVLYAQWRKA